MFKIKSGIGFVDKKKLLKELKKVLNGKIAQVRMSKKAQERLYLAGTCDGLEMALRFIR